MSKYRSLIFVIGLILIGKLSGLFKDLLITYYHGVSTVTDAYFLSSSIASLLYMAVYAAVPILMVPRYSRFLLNRQVGGVNRQLSAGLFFFLLVSLTITVAVLAAADFLVDLFTGEIDHEVRTRAVGYLSIMAWTFALSTLVAFFNAIQTVNKVTQPSYFVPIVNNSVFCIGLFLFSSADEFTLILVLGVVAWLLLTLINGWICRTVFSVVFTAAFDLLLSKRFLFLFLPAVLAFYIEQANNYVGVYFASELGLGAISVYGYANKLNMVFVSVYVVFLTASLFPRIAAVAAQNDRVLQLNYLVMCIRVVTILVMPAVIYMYVYSNEIVTLIFQRGQFIVEDSARVSAVFSLILLALPFCLVRDLVNRVFFSNHDTVVPVLMTLFSLCVNFLICFIFYRQFGLSGVASSSVVSTVLHCFLALVLAQRRFGLNLLVPFLRIALICVSVSMVVGGLLHYFGSLFEKYWLLMGIPFYAVYFLILLAIRVKEAVLVREGLGKLFVR